MECSPSLAYVLRDAYRRSLGALGRLDQLADYPSPAYNAATLAYTCIEFRGLSMASERIQRRIDRLLDQAEEAMDQLKWDAVGEYAQAALGLDPGNTDALAYLDSA